MKNMRKIKILKLTIFTAAVFGLGFLAFSGEAQAANRLVTTGGVSSGDCTVTACNIEYAINTVAQSGDVVSVAAGTYNIPGGGLAPKSGVTVIGAGKDEAIIDGARSLANGWQVASPSDCHRPGLSPAGPNCPPGIYYTVLSDNVSSVYVMENENKVSKILFASWPKKNALDGDSCGSSEGYCSSNYEYTGNMGDTCYWGNWAQYLGVAANGTCSSYNNGYQINKDRPFWGFGDGLFAWRSSPQISGSPKLFVGFKNKSLNPSSLTIKYSKLGDKCFNLTDRSNVTLSDLTIQNCEANVYLNRSHNNTISNNYIGNGNIRIYALDSNSNMIKHNIMEVKKFGDKINGTAPNRVACNRQPAIYGTYQKLPNNNLYCASTDFQKVCATTGGTPVKSCSNDLDCPGVPCIEINGYERMSAYLTHKFLDDYDRDNRIPVDFGVWILTGNGNKLFRNSLTNTYHGLNTFYSKNSEVAGNYLYNIVSAGVPADDRGGDLKVHDNVFQNCMEVIDFQFNSRNYNGKLYFYNNRVYNPPYTGLDFLNERKGSSDPITNSQVFLYHNSFAGGKGLYNNSNCGWDNSVSPPTYHCYFVNMGIYNNIISTPVLAASSTGAYVAGNSYYGRPGDDTYSKSIQYSENGGINKSAASLEAFEAGDYSLFWPMDNAQTWDDVPNWYKAWTDSDNERGGRDVNNLPNGKIVVGFAANYWDSSKGSPLRGWTGHAPAPVLSSAISTAGSITLNWSSHGLTASSRSGRIVEDWVVLRKLSTETEYKMVAELIASTTYTDTSAEDGKTYDYMIHAVYDDGSVSIPSNVKTTSQDNPADINGDDKVNIKDIQSCIKMITGSDKTFEANCQKVALPDNVTNIKDIQEIIRKIINPN